VVLRDALWNQQPPLERVLKAIRTAKPRAKSEKKSAPRQNRRFTKREITEIVANYESGIGTYELARTYACHRTTIAKLLNRNAVKRRSHNIAPDRLSDAAARYAEGQSLAQIAKGIGISPTTVLKHLRSMGVSIREANR